MYFLAQSICEMESLNPVWNVVGFIIKALWIGIPLLMIILGTIDLGKAVIASKEDEVKKAWKAFGRRLLYTVAVFLVVWIVGVVLSTVSNIGEGAVNYNEAGWKACWNKIIK